MPFSNYTADPECMEAMRTAFHQICNALRLNGEVDDPVTELIVTKIVALAKAGESDADRLCAQVLAELAGPKRLSGLAP
jgi:hypothetical protein